MAKLLGKVFGVGLLWLTLGVSSAAAQSNDQGSLEGSKRGPLNAWTTRMVLRENIGKGADYLKMRVGRHNGYDRIVFELGSDVPNFYVNYQRLPFELESGDEISNISGKAFIEISIYPVNYAEKYQRAIEDMQAQSDRVRLPVLSTVKSLGWFEGEMRYAIGLKARTPFRVQTLSNPARLVVDFKR